MQTPLQVSFHGMDKSASVEERIREKAEKLERYYGRMEGINVVVDADSRRHRNGNLYNIKIGIGVPGKDVFIDHSGPQNHAHEDINVAIRDAFDAARRKLEDHVRRLRGDVKSHSRAAKATIVQRGEETAVAETETGEKLTLERSRLSADFFDRLSVGAAIHVTLLAAENGAIVDITDVVLEEVS